MVTLAVRSHQGAPRRSTDMERPCQVGSGAVFRRGCCCSPPRGGGKGGPPGARRGRTRWPRRGGEEGGGRGRGGRGDGGAGVWGGARRAAGGGAGFPPL